jgi:hypothetical protein
VDSSDAARIVAWDTTVANKIRALDAAGYPRKEIARLLQKRPQHVRNVLEDDKLYGRRPRVPAPEAEPPHVQVAEAPRSFGDVHRLNVEADGVIRLPPDVQAVLGARPGGILIGELGADRFVILSVRAAALKAQALIAGLGNNPDRLLSEELIADRRAEAAREEADG